MKLEDCIYKEVCSNKCSESCVRFLEMEYLLEHSNIPPSKWKPVPLYPDDCDYDSFVKLASIKNDVQNFVKSGKNLYLYSTGTGNGKTTWSIKIMLKYFDIMWAGNGFKRRGIFIHVPTFLTQLKNFGVKDNQFEQIKQDLTTVDLVIFDDIASTDMSSYDNGQLLTYIDQRVLNQKSCIFTGNLDNPEITQSLGIRLASRVWNNSEKIKLNGKDNRR